MKIFLILAIVFFSFCVIGYLAACGGAGKFINFIDWLLLKDKTKNENDKNTPN